MEVDGETVVAVAPEVAEEVVMTSPEKTENTDSDIKSPSKDKVTDQKKNNGTLTGVAAAAAATAVIRKREDEKSQMSGIIVQLPEMFSMKRDYHILKKFEEAEDVRMQRCAFIECESEEAAVALQAKLNNSTINSMKVHASRLDTQEKNVLYLGALKKDTTDDILKELLVGVEEIRREKYNVFIKFTSETECRAAKAKINREGLNGQISLACDFDLKKDRFKPAEEPPAKKVKEDEEGEKESEEKPATEEKAEEPEAVSEEPTKEETVTEEPEDIDY